MAIDVVIIAYSLTFRQLTQALYGIAMMYICTTMIDKVVYGGNAAKMTYIISSRHEEITRQLLEMDLGVTLLEGSGAYAHKTTQAVMCAFSRSYVIPVKKLVQRSTPMPLLLSAIPMRYWERASVPTTLRGCNFHNICVHHT